MPIITKKEYERLHNDINDLKNKIEKRDTIIKDLNEDLEQVLKENKNLKEEIYKKNEYINSLKDLIKNLQEDFRAELKDIIIKIAKKD